MPLESRKMRENTPILSVFIDSVEIMIGDFFSSCLYMSGDNFASKGGALENNLE